MAFKTLYICQAYEHRSQGEQRSVLAIVHRMECMDATSAVVRAEKLFESGDYAGADAYSIDVDTEFDDYGLPQFLIRLGDVPDMEPG